MKIPDWQHWRADPPAYLTNAYCTGNSKTNFPAQHCPCGLARPSLRLKGYFIHFTHQPLISQMNLLTSTSNTFAILFKKWGQPFLILMHPKNIGQRQLLSPPSKISNDAMESAEEIQQSSGISSGLGSSCNAVQQLVSYILPWKLLHNQHPGFDTVWKNNWFSLY